MSASAALQIAVIAALLANAGVTGYLGQRIWDNAPPEMSDATPEPYLTLGPSQEIDDGADCIDGVECFQQIDIWTHADGAQLSAKMISGAVRKALHAADLVLSAPYSLVLIEVESTRVIADPNTKTAHGIIMVRALVEAE